MNILNSPIMRFIYILLVVCFFNNQQLIAQQETSHNLKFDISNYENDTLILGYYYGDRQLVKDTILRDNKGKFQKIGDEVLHEGMYLALLKPANSFIQFLLPADDQKFEIKLNAQDISEVSFKGSDINEKFYKYLDYLSTHRTEAEDISLKIALADSLGTIQEKVALEKQQEKLNEKVTAEQKKLVSENKGNLFGNLIQANFIVDIPEYEGTEDRIKELQYLYYRDHFFDHIDPAVPSNIHMPYLHGKVEQYIDKMTPQHPDTIIRVIDAFLDRVQPAPETFKFYLSHFLNKYASSRIIGMDAVFVHLVDQFYAQGLAPWVDETNLSKLVGSANRIRPTLIGKTGADLTLYRQDSTAVTLSEIECDYMVLMFWAPSCGHCTKAMPYAVEFNEKYKDKGVKFISICTKHQDQYESCWKAIESKNMENFLNLGDRNHTSRFKSKYNVDKTPKIFIMDSNRKILMNGIGAQQLETVMDNIIKETLKEKEKEMK